MHFSKSKQIPGKYPKCRLLWGEVGGGGEEEEARVEVRMKKVTQVVISYLRVTR